MVYIFVGMFLTITSKSILSRYAFTKKNKKGSLMEVLFIIAIIAGLVTGGIGGALGVAALFIAVAYGLDCLNAQKEATEKSSEEAERLQTEAEYAANKEYWDMKKSQYKAEILESLRSESRKVGQGEETSFQEVKGGF